MAERDVGDHHQAQARRPRAGRSGPRPARRARSRRRRRPRPSRARTAAPRRRRRIRPGRSRSRRARRGSRRRRSSPGRRAAGRSGASRRARSAPRRRRSPHDGARGRATRRRRPRTSRPARRRACRARRRAWPPRPRPTTARRRRRPPRRSPPAAADVEHHRMRARGERESPGEGERVAGRRRVVEADDQIAVHGRGPLGPGCGSGRSCGPGRAYLRGDRRSRSSSGPAQARRGSHVRAMRSRRASGRYEDRGRTESLRSRVLGNGSSRGRRFVLSLRPPLLHDPDRSVQDRRNRQEP